MGQKPHLESRVLGARGAALEGPSIGDPGVVLQGLFWAPR